MCGTCGCGQPDQHHEEPSHVIELHQNIMSKNDQFAENNRDYFKSQNIFAINLLSSPGAGKTTLLVNTLQQLKNKPIAVIEGDQQTDHDAQKIAATGVLVKQINTGHGCHLDAHAIGHANTELNLTPGTLLFIENVGNLICPALFDLGEACKVVMLSTTEGDDKPLKYPDAFASANIMLINKIDLLPYVNFNVEKSVSFAKRINPSIKVFQLSATTGQGMQLWYDWLLHHDTSNLAENY